MNRPSKTYSIKSKKKYNAYNISKHTPLRVHHIFEASNAAFFFAAGDVPGDLAGDLPGDLAFFAAGDVPGDAAGEAGRLFVGLLIN